jgi:hypothetical protein
LCFCSAPFALVALAGFASSSMLFLILSRTKRRALVLTGVEFSVRLYWVCHHAGHMCNRGVARSVSSRGNTVLVA